MPDKFKTFEIKTLKSCFSLIEPVPFFVQNSGRGADKVPYLREIRAEMMLGEDL